MLRHVITVGDVLRTLGAGTGLFVLLVGVWLLIAVVNAKFHRVDRDTSLVTGFGSLCTLLGFGVIMLMLSACETSPVTKLQTIYVKEPVAVQSIKPSDVPPVPAQLGPRPPTLKQQADALLAARCDAIAFVIKAYPAMLTAAGLPAAQAPDYKECDKH